MPVFLFVNKMDQPGTDPEKVLTELQKKLDSNITSVGKLLQPGDNEGERETELEHAAMCSEALMEEYLETGELSAENISDTVAERKLAVSYTHLLPGTCRLIDGKRKMHRNVGMV